MPENKVVGEIKLDGVGYVVEQKPDGRYATRLVAPGRTHPAWDHWGSIRLLNEMREVLDDAIDAGVLSD